MKKRRLLTFEELPAIPAAAKVALSSATFVAEATIGAFTALGGTRFVDDQRTAH